MKIIFSYILTLDQFNLKDWVPLNKIYLKDLLSLKIFECLTSNKVYLKD